MNKQRKQHYSPTFKLKVVMELLMGIRTATEIANDYGISSATLISWRKTFKERLPSLFEKSNASTNKGKPSVSESEIRLERKMDCLLRKFNQVEDALKEKALQNIES